jgi:hypothetical protein
MALGRANPVKVISTKRRKQQLVRYLYASIVASISMGAYYLIRVEDIGTRGGFPFQNSIIGFFYVIVVEFINLWLLYGLVRLVLYLYHEFIGVPWDEESDIVSDPQPRPHIVGYSLRQRAKWRFDFGIASAVLLIAFFVSNGGLAPLILADAISAAVSWEWRRFGSRVLLNALDVGPFIILGATWLFARRTAVRFRELADTQSDLNPIKLSDTGMLVFVEWPDGELTTNFGVSTIVWPSIVTRVELSAIEPSVSKALRRYWEYQYGGKPVPSVFEAAESQVVSMLRIEYDRPYRHLVVPHRPDAESEEILHSLHRTILGNRGMGFVCADDTEG